MKSLPIFSFTVCILAASMAPGCGSASSQAEPASSAPAVVATGDPEGDEAERVRQAVRDYVVANPGAAEETFDLPGDEHGEAALTSFHSVHRHDQGYLVCVDFRDDEHLYDVDFTLSGGESPQVISAALHKIDDEVVSD